jgi:hypothetical protein
MDYSADNSGTGWLGCDPCPDGCHYCDPSYDHATQVQMGLIVIGSDDLSDDIEVLDEFEPNDVIYIIFTRWLARQKFFIMFPLDHAGRWFSGTVP